MAGGLIEGFLGLAMLVIVPLALPLHPWLGRRWVWPAVAAAVPAVVGLALDQSLVAAILCLPWLLGAGAVAASSALRWLQRERTLVALVDLAAPAFLTVGAGWLELNRLGVEPLGITEPFVLLTALHFHYAGFTAALLAGLVRRATAARSPRTSAVMAAAVIGAPPVIAAGFTFAGVLQVVGAAVLALGLFALAWLTLRHVVPSVEDAPARALLIVSAVAVLAPMVLAVQWAAGWNFGTPALSIPAMARTHGVLNALGFSLCGVLGWRRVQSFASAARVPADAWLPET